MIQILSLHQVIVITRLTFREALRRKLLWVGLGLGLAYVALFALGFYFSWKDFRSGPGGGFITPALFAQTLTIAGLYVVNFLVVMVTVLTSVGTISAEISSHTIHTLASKPIRRREIILGKWLGHGIMLALYTMLLAFGVIFAAFVISGHLVSAPLLGVAILILESLATLSITLLGSTLLSTLTNGVVAFMLYGVAFVGGWMEQIGSVLGSQTAVDLGIASSFLMPSESLWRYASSVMQDSGGLSVMVSPFSIFSEPSDLFVVYSIIYTLGLLLLAMWSFDKRDF